MNSQHTFQNLMHLENSRSAARSILKDRYFEVVGGFRTVIEKVMAANGEDHFEATKRIFEQTPELVPDERHEILFASALMEIVEEINLKGLKN